MSALWTPGQRPEGPLRILVPGQYAGQMELVCRIPKGDGICGETFRTEPALMRHLRLCSARHEEEIRSQSLRARMPMFDPESWDPEVSAHMREVGRRMVKERRLTVKSSERAGFS